MHIGDDGTELEQRRYEGELLARIEHLESIVRMADQLATILYEFPNEPAAAAEYLDALSAGLEQWKQSQ